MAALAVLQEPVTSTELSIPAKADKTGIANLFQPNGMDDIIARIRAEITSQDYDISTEKGRKAMASAAYKVARSKTTLDDLGKNLVSDLKAQSSAVDAERKKMRDALDTLRDEVRQPLDEWENREKVRVQGHEDALKQIADIAMDCSGRDVAGVQALIASAHADDQRDWQEFAKRHGEVRNNVLYILSGAMEDAQRHERERAEAERIEQEERARQQAERDARIREEAAFAARAEAEAIAARQAREAEQRVQREREAAARVQREAEAQAERERQAAALAHRQAEERARAAEAAVQRAKEDAARAVEREQARVAEEKRKELAATEKREASKRHSAAVNRGIVAVLVAIGISEDHARLAVVAMAKGEVPNVKVSY